eukprot:scaffold1673_cov330-Pavlova_lutheri.AAC.6
MPGMGLARVRPWPGRETGNGTRLIHVSHPYGNEPVRPFCKVHCPSLPWLLLSTPEAGVPPFPLPTVTSPSRSNAYC